jgi:dienelactone hydrolase
MKNDDAHKFTVKEEVIEDAVFAAEILRKDNRINPGKVFVLGHSLGGMLAPRIDAEGGNFSGLIIWAGSPRRLDEIMIDQQDAFMETANFFVKLIAGRQIKKLRERLNRMYDMTDEESMKASFFGKYAKLYYMKEMGEKSAVRYLKDLTKPILIMQGDKDFHVSVEKDFNKYKEILANHQNAAFKLYPNLNHLFMPNVYGDIKKAFKEYKKPQNVEECVINDIAGWVKTF